MDPVRKLAQSRSPPPILGLSLIIKAVKEQKQVKADQRSLNTIIS